MNVLLVHGLFGSLHFPELLGAFPAAVSVHAPDLLGYGAHHDIDTSQLSLGDQVEHLVTIIKAQTAEPVHVVGHSVGGAIGLMLASDHPELVCSYMSVEGNMTLKDAFWSATIADSPIESVEDIIESYKVDVGAWLAGAGVISTADHIRIATQWLQNQPATTIKAQAAAVVTETARSDYLQRFEQLAKNGTAIHLLAGEKSIAGWDLPDNIITLSNSMNTLKNCGHLMMLEDPVQFARTVCESIE
jgi:pimeloyl-ACP methyl ester carboxylesterase